MRKRITLCLMAVATVLAFTGCKNKIPEMTDEETKMVEEYAAELLLKYDRNYHSNVLDEEKLAEVEYNMEQKAQHQAMLNEMHAQQALSNEDNSEGEGGEDSGESETVYSDIDEFLGLSGIDIEFTNMTVGKTYPDVSNMDSNSMEGYVTASGGNNLVVMEFTATNNTGGDASLDIASMGVKASYKIGAEKPKTKTPITTLLTNDFMYYRGTIPAGESVKLVMVLEVYEEDSEAITAVSMTLKCAGNSMSTKLM